MPVQRETAVGMPQESSSSICKLTAFYQKYKIEFHISGMVFCLIGGKVRRCLLFFSLTGQQASPYLFGTVQTKVPQAYFLFFCPTLYALL